MGHVPSWCIKDTIPCAALVSEQLHMLIPIAMRVCSLLLPQVLQRFQMPLGVQVGLMAHRSSVRHNSAVLVSLSH